jgi:hypothetical protein
MAALLRDVVNATFWLAPWASTYWPLVAPPMTWSWKNGQELGTVTREVEVTTADGLSEMISVVVVVAVAVTNTVEVSVIVSSSPGKVMTVVMVLVDSVVSASTSVVVWLRKGVVLWVTVIVSVLVAGGTVKVEPTTPKHEHAEE